ncbi:MAG: DNA-directed RNA polymerase subunit alpha [bacterium]
MQKPTFAINTIKEELAYGQFAIEPLENGFGHTLGNALRRVLLSSFRGAAITKVKVEGVTHKFSTLAGVSDDMVDLMLNLKNLKVAYLGEEPVTAKLSVKGPRTVTAKDIVLPPGVKIVNEDAPITKLATGAKLDLELEIATGFGYSPAEDRTTDTVGELILDAIFSPVERVSYVVEATRVGRRTDYDKLLIDIYTDGSQSPASVLVSAAQTLQDYFAQIVDPKIEVEEVSNSVSGSPSISIEELGLPTRITNALKNAEYMSVATLVTATNKDLKNVKNLGGKSIDLLDEALAAKGFTREK